MIYVFIPYWHEDTPEFKKSLESQYYKNYIVIRRNRKASKILWTKAVNDFWKETFRWCGTKDDDVICIMNNDVNFGENLFEEASKIKKGQVQYMEGVWIDWESKRLDIMPVTNGDSFTGHYFAMTLGDFKNSGGFCKYLPHALADIDFGIKMMKRLDSVFINSWLIHPDHDYEPLSKWSLRSYENPFLWTIFLLKNPNRYLLKNLMRVWYDGLFR